MSRQQRRADKVRRHARPPTSPVEPSWSRELPTASPKPVVVREVSYVERLAYTRSQAAAALGISRSTLRRLLPHLETIEMPWGGKLIPVDELERLVAERRRTAVRGPKPTPGRKPTVAPEIVERIRAERSAGRSLREIAAGLDDDGIPTAHHARQWWPSTVRAILTRDGARRSQSADAR
jgi:hypothetical protein